MKSSDFAKNLCFTSSILNRITNKIALTELSVIGLSPSYAFLIIAVHEKPGIRIKELARVLYLDSSSVSRLIEKLEVKKYILRDYSPGISQVYLTDLGNQAYNNVMLAMNQYLDQYKAALGKKRTKELSRSLMATAEELRGLPVE